MICLLPSGTEAAAVGEQMAIARPAQDQDSAAIERCIGGDLSAFRALVERHQRAVYAVVSRILPNRDDADDIVQEVFVQAYRSIASFRGDASFSTWLCRIAINAAIKRAKTQGRRQTISLDDEEFANDALLRSEDPGPEEQIQRSARDAAVRKAVMALPEKHRLVVAMHYFDGHSCQEIADTIGCSVGTVWSRLHYASRKLKEDLAWLLE